MNVGRSRFWLTVPVVAVLAICAQAPAHAERPLAGSAAQVVPRALTAQELSARGLLGRYQGLDPDLYGRIWRSGHDPRTCKSAQFLALVYRQSITDLKISLENAVVRRNAWGENSAANYEIAIADLLQFNGRDSEAERFLKQRMLVLRIDPNSDIFRIEALQQRLAAIYTATRPDEAERLLSKIVASRQTAAQADFAAAVNGYPVGGDAWQYASKFRDRRNTAIADELLGSFYRRTGQQKKALDLALAALAPLEAETRAITNPAIGPPAGLDKLRLKVSTLRAEIADKAGQTAAAEAGYRACCSASSALARLLLRSGNLEAARIVLARMMIDVGSDTEEIFDCMRAPDPANVDQAVANAMMVAREMVPNPNVTYVTEDGGGGGGDTAYRVSRVTEAAARLARATELGELLVEAGLYADARAVLLPTFGLQGVMLNASHPDALRSLAALARTMRLLHRPDAAIYLWSQWQRLRGEFLANRLWSVNEDDRRRFFRDDKRNVDQYIAALRDAAPADAATQLLAVSLGHKGLLARVAGQIDVRARTAGNAQSAALLTQLQKLRGQFAALALHDRTSSPGAMLVRRQIDDIESQIAALPGIGAASADTASPAALVAALKQGETLIDFQSFRDPDASDGPARERLVAVVARPNAPADIIWWPDIAPVRAAAARFRRAILASGDAELAESGRAFADLLWKPLEAKLANASRLLLGLDDVLDVVPLAALPDNAGKPLVQRYQLIALGALQELLSVPSAPAATVALVVGNPAYGAIPGGGSNARAANRVIAVRGSEIAFGPLPGTATEIAGVNALLAQRYATRLLQGTAATKAAVATARSPAILHLATHGFFLTGLEGSSDEGDPLVSLSRSGLAFANANIGIRSSPPGAGPEGILTALESVSLDLRGTGLVVLSACETALGEIASGEGVYGLAQALHQAGARTVLATLWPVSDAATSAFMQLFYARLAAGDDPQLALRSAQIAFATSDKWHDPIFWAPFMLTGR